MVKYSSIGKFKKTNHNKIIGVKYEILNYKLIAIYCKIIYN
ncbi:hypothetical protein CNEO_310038 [Clostridium neonatale]|nr:hypothetical protein CNEO_310038 [Clostridium neonatale]CAI3534977.1 hypothetical protein CNEO3_100039 [Clostridium neonatale]CAI3577831.1 hypothetical protein CNEO4_160040 [Clostridium neonatale]